MKRLQPYRRKRDFGRTPEPAGGEATGAGRYRYVIQKHRATRLHYDLRLEQDGVLRSWALPKGPSLEPGEKRQAVEVEDHLLEYGEFEGTIPKGAYGGGTVMLWDRGRWTPTGDGVRDGRIDFELEGAKLRGAWTLTRTGGRAGGGGEADDANWLLIKRTDPGASPLEPDDRSVLTGRTMAQIERGEEASADAATEDVSANAVDNGPDVADPGALEGAKRAKPPPEPALQLASLAGEPPEGDDWIHEIKYDGYRLLAHVDGGEVQLLTRNGHDWTDRFPEIAAALARVPVRLARLDGEVVSLRADGVSRFGALQEALASGDTARLRYQVFDLLHLGDHDLRGVAQDALARSQVHETKRVRRGRTHRAEGLAYRLRRVAVGSLRRRRPPLRWARRNRLRRAHVEAAHRAARSARATDAAWVATDAVGAEGSGGGTTPGQDGPARRGAAGKGSSGGGPRGGSSGRKAPPLREGEALVAGVRLTNADRVLYPQQGITKRDLADLVGLVQAGVLEVHVWGSRIDDVERPDLLIIDLDPSPGVDWAVTRATALDLRARIDDLGLTSFLRTTGGKGLHLVAPLVRRHGWDDVKAFARALCERHAADTPIG